MKDFSNTLAAASVNDKVQRKIDETTGESGTRRTYTVEEMGEYQSHFQTAGRKGCKLPRMNMAFSPELYIYIQTMARANGMTLTEFVNRIVRDHKEAHIDAYNRVLELRDQL